MNTWVKWRVVDVDGIHLGDVEKIQFALVVAIYCQNSHKNAWRKKWIFVINVFCKSCSGLNIAAGMRRPLPQMHCHRYPPAKLNKSKRKERHVLFPYFCFGFIGAKIKMFAYFLQTCIHSIIKLYGICWHISHSNCIFQFSEEWMQETAEMTRFNLPLSWTKAEWVMGYKWSFWFQENLNVNKSEEKNSGQISVASKGDFVKV